MRPEFYSLGGLSVASELPLPGYSACDPPPDEKPDVIIRIHAVIDALPSDRRGVSVVPGECRLSVPGVGLFEIRNGCEISVRPVPDVAPLALRTWLMGAAWGALCYQRGILIVHASAIQVDRRAVLFCAPVGGGKSTLAAIFNRMDYPLIADDLCHIDIPDAGPPLVYPAAPALRLWSDALRTFGWDTRVDDPDPFRPGKFRVILPQDRLLAPVPLGAIYLLQWGNFSIERLSGFTAWRRLLSGATYRPRLFDSIMRMNHYFGRTVAILQQIPLWELRRPRDFAAIDEIAGRIARHWAESHIIGE